jgi:choline kinase
MKTLVICAAGSSERLKKLTKNKPKSLIKIGNKMIINLVLECFSFDIIKKIYIITGFKNNLLKKNIDKKFMHKIQFVNNKIYKKTGNMHSLSLVGNKTKSDIIFVNADNLIEKSVVKKFIEKNPDKTPKEIGAAIGTKDALYVIKRLGITYKKTLSLRGKYGNI